MTTPAILSISPEAKAISSMLKEVSEAHKELSDMHEMAGEFRLARLARWKAYERRLAADYFDHYPSHGLKAALEYGDDRRKAGV
jgi:hypothetical protein